tara:strand:- start:952 stop:1893 length:942 start_codon:yes stop_codon:yes gene_type:complete
MNEEQIFSKKFLSLDQSLISEELKKNGFFCCENALTSNFLNNINKDVADSGLSMNTNNIAGVYFTHGNQFFITHMLAVSESFFNYCTNNKILDICSNYLGDKYRLKDLRYYENFGGQVMQWHTDNRFYDKEKKGETHTTSPGLIFLAYISDVEDGEFQYIRGSHVWSGEYKHHDFTQEYIQKNYKEDVVGFKKPKGSILIYNSWGVHRAKPTVNKKFTRKTLFFQVDKDINHSEPILIKTEFLNKIDDRLKLFLGFGKKADLKIYPETNLYTMPMNKKTFVPILKWFISLLAFKLPGFLRKRVRKLFDIPSNK